jgi:hypothetical protein
MADTSQKKQIVFHLKVYKTKISSELQLSITFICSVFQYVQTIHAFQYGKISYKYKETKLEKY